MIQKITAYCPYCKMSTTIHSTDIEQLKERNITLGIKRLHIECEYCMHDIPIQTETIQQ